MWWCFTLSRGSLCNVRDRNRNEAGKFRTSDILGWSLFLLYLQSFRAWKLWKLGGVVDDGGLGWVCGGLVIPHPPIWCRTVVLCLSLWFSPVLTEALYTLEGSVLCSGFVGLSFVTARQQDTRERIFHPIILQQLISYKNITGIFFFFTCM